MSFNIGDRVVIGAQRDTPGVIVGACRRIGGEDWFPVQFGARRDQVLAADLLPYDDDHDLEGLLRQGVFASNAALTRRLTLCKLRTPLKNTLYSLDSSRTEFHPHQFKPLLKFLASDRRRLLIADEVGLGKTIEAGYILREQRARHDIERVLVVCPASLRIKWEVELRQRFGERFEILDSSRFRSLLLLSETDERRRRFSGIVSLQSIRSDPLIQLIEERSPDLDLLIVDEAHHCRNAGTGQHQAIRALASSSDSVLFLTATPLHLTNEDLFNQLRLLLPEEFDRADVFADRVRLNEYIVKAETALRRTDGQGPAFARESLAMIEGSHSIAARSLRENPLLQEARQSLSICGSGDRHRIVEIQETLADLNLLSHVMTRTKKREAYPNAAIREPQTVRVEMTDVEREVYQRVYSFCAERYSKAHGDVAAQFPLVTLERQLASSIHAMLEHYAEAIDNIGAAVADGIEEDDDSDDLDEPANGQEFSSATCSLAGDPQFRELISQSRVQLDGATDSRLSELLVVLRSSHKKVVVFATFRRSLTYLERRLTQEGIKCVRVDGSVPMNPLEPERDERVLRVRQFQHDEETRVLLSSQVLREGHDLQFCDTLVNWDLPWNPMDVEQRIGRLDRLGQKSERILIFSFSTPGTIEGRILDRLYTRVGLFEGAIGPLEPILGQEIKQLTNRLFDYHLSQEQREAEVERTARVLEKRLLDEQKLEEAAPELFGHDQIFRERMERIRRLGRYVTPGELESFVQGYMRDEHPQTPLVRSRDSADEGKVLQLRMSTAMRDAVRQAVPLNDPSLLQFLGRAGNETLRITFDPQQAMQDARLELIHSQHPLVKAIAHHYERHPAAIQPSVCVEVATNSVPQADYFFTWTTVNETGLQAGRSLWAEAVSADGTHRLTPDEAEELLNQAALQGRPWRGFSPPDGECSLTLYRECSDSLARRVVARKEQATQQNRARVESRITALKASTDVRRRQKTDLLHKHQAHGRANVAKLFEAQLRKLEADYEQRLAELDRGRDVRVTFADDQGAGFVRVTASE